MLISQGKFIIIYGVIFHRGSARAIATAPKNQFEGEQYSSSPLNLRTDLLSSSIDNKRLCLF